MTQTELDVYGSSRLGIWKRAVNVSTHPASDSSSLPLLGNGDSLIFTRGSKLFELTNHLGNVLSTISDKRYGVTGDDSTVAYYNSDVVSANDYYPGGMEMPGRTYVAGNGYRYGYQGSEKDKELNTNTYTTLFREDDTRINRWWSPDPKSSASPWSSPYVVNGNNPIIMIDPFGDQEYESMKAYRKATGNKKLGQGDWLSKDRTGNTDVWKTPILIT